MPTNRFYISRYLLVGLLGLLVLSLAVSACQSNQPVDFNTEIRPVLNANCLNCHSGVKQSGGLNLLFRDMALKAGDSGQPAIVPGDADASELMRRITHHDPEERMPLEKPPLSEEQIEAFRQWINEGAPWDDHWAYLPPERPELPRASGSWAINEIDHFTLARMKEQGLSPAKPASRASLLRRLSLDLIGLPPTPEEVRAFEENKAEDAYEQAVDRLLASPRFGERWAALWMDLARYADSKGYEKDPYRSIWKYRDWIIQAFNEDKPFDQFTIEQLAGDLLPQPSQDQLIATAFHRNTMNNTEGGTEDEEFRVASVIDRVNTTWTVWQGTTMECVQCHGHPYDPFRQKDYYHFLDFFNQSMDADLDSEVPFLETYEPETVEQIEAVITQLAQQQPAQQLAASLPPMGKIRQALFPRILAGDCDDFQDVEISGTWEVQNWARNPNNIPQKNFWLKYAAIQLDEVTRISYTCRAFGDLAALELRLDAPDGPLVHRVDVPQSAKQWKTVSAPLAVKGVHDLFLIPVNKNINDPEGRMVIRDLYLHQPGYASTQATEALRDSLLRLRKQAVRTPIMQEKTLPRQTHVFERGNWLVKGEAIQTADVPSYLPDLPADVPNNRLGMARWLVSRDNPLTARVTVNRFWEQLFGRGIVETSEDFGTQGMPPSHPELLDWLAVSFMEDMQWRLKPLLKTMVMSATYRQTSEFDPTSREKDPRNTWLARGPRVRLTSEQVRDQALAVSGLLSDKMYGPSVMPPQPEGVWQVVYSGKQWNTSEGEDKYRRAIYTYWRRTSPYPSLVTFDSPSREFCVSRRIRTNTPLQALVTLNDPVFVEAANALGERMLREGGSAVEGQLAFGFEQALLRAPSEAELEVLQSLYEQAMESDATDEAEAPKEVAQPVSDRRAEADPQQRALSVVANAILNLDGFLTKE